MRALGSFFIRSFIISESLTFRLVDWEDSMKDGGGTFQG